MFLRSVAILLFVDVSIGYRHLQDQIPNGDQVPHPCKPNFIWRGVGHLNPLGGGARNPFGLDFYKHGKTWTKALCETDSDGDGLTNGQELGDPNCVWTKASDKFPERTYGISHPGVCDPWGSTHCAEKNADITCDTGEFICPAIHEPHVKNFTLRFPKTLVPAEETSYMCMSFDLKFPDDDPPDQEYHLIATQPIIDNPNVMHHAVIFGCSDTAARASDPSLCYMAQDGCFRTLGIWTLGLPGECIYKDAGFKIGRNSSHVMLQFHWTNPQRRTDYYDESGMILYYTSKLRKYNAGVLVTGQTNLVIPPGQERVVQHSTCSSECTRSTIDTGVFIASGYNHMHYLGFQQNVEQYRDDKKIRDLTNDEVYSYDNPVIHVYDPPHRLLPGDRLETTCVYRSLSRRTTTYYGEGTYEEMCFGIFTVFPEENVSMISCDTWDNIESCQWQEMIGDCIRWQFFDKQNPETIALRRLVLDNCNFYGSCRPECPAALAKAKEHPCLQGQALEYNIWNLRQSKLIEDVKFLAALSSCDCAETEDANVAPDEDGVPTLFETDINNNNNGQFLLSSVATLLLSLPIAFLFSQ